MHSLMCVLVVVSVVRKPCPCLSYSRRRDRINSVLWRSYYKGGGVLRVELLRYQYYYYLFTAILTVNLGTNDVKKSLQQPPGMISESETAVPLLQGQEQSPFWGTGGRGL